MAKTYKDPHGVVWNVDLANDHPEGALPWTAGPADAAYGIPPGGHVVAADEEQMLYDAIDDYGNTYVTQGGHPDDRPSIPQPQGPTAPAQMVAPPEPTRSSSWLFALILGGFYYLNKKTKGRRR